MNHGFHTRTIRYLPWIPLTASLHSTKVNSCCCGITISINTSSQRVPCIKFQSILARSFPFGRLHSRLLLPADTIGTGWKTGAGRMCQASDRCGSHLAAWRHVTSQPSVQHGNRARGVAALSVVLCNNNVGSSSFLYAMDRGERKKYSYVAR